MGSGPALHLTTMLPQEAGTTSCVCTGVRCVVPGPRASRGQAEALAEVCLTQAILTHRSPWAFKNLCPGAQEPGLASCSSPSSRSYSTGKLDTCPRELGSRDGTRVRPRLYLTNRLFLPCE
jgi:hypothetical protein